jgi:hypothetical protein
MERTNHGQDGASPLISVLGRPSRGYLRMIEIGVTLLVPVVLAAGVSAYDARGV